MAQPARVARADLGLAVIDSHAGRGVAPAAAAAAAAVPASAALEVLAALMTRAALVGLDATKFVGLGSGRGTVRAAQADRSAAAGRPMVRAQVRGRVVAQVGVPVRGRECVAVIRTRLYRGGAHALP